VEFLMIGAVRFVRVPTEFLEALLRTPLSGTQWRILGWMMRQTWGWNRDTTSFSWYQIAKDLTLDRGGVARAGNRLLEAGIVARHKSDLRLERDFKDWRPARKLREPGAAMMGVSADESHPKAMANVTYSDDNCQRKRCQESALFRRAKDSSKDKLKTCKDRGKTDDPHCRRGPGNTQQPHLAGEARPVAGKYDRLSED
jgi:phage replication O-like protein O